MPHRLLLADDSVTIQRVIELTFAEEDVNVTAVGDGQQAIDQIQTEPPDIVLTDIVMPGPDGYEVAAFVKGNAATAHIPVVLLTGAYEPVDEARAKAIGCDGVMVKPFEPQMVINRVQELLAGRRPASLWTAPLDGLGDAGDAAEVEAPGSAQGQISEPAATVSDSGFAAVADAGEPLGEALDASPLDDTAVDASATETESLDNYLDQLNQAFGTTAEPAAAPPLLADAPVTDLPSAEPPSAGGASEPIEVEPSSPLAGIAGPADVPLSTEPSRFVAGMPAADSAIAVPTTAPTSRTASAGETVPEVPDAAPEPEIVPEVVSEAPPGPLSQAATAGEAVPEPLSLSEIFSALLAAEQSWPSPSITPGDRAASVLATERLVADVTRRVLGQVTDRVVRETVTREVAQVTERLVREEIERIKSMADADAPR